MTRLSPLFALLLVLSACNWVELTSEGEGVTLMEPAAVQNCQRVGRVTARSTDEIVTVDRSSERLQNELVTLARNEAGALGGNAIVPESVIQDGVQIFGVYTCP
jgi:hypothetical protein